MWLECKPLPDCNRKDKHGFTPLHYAAKFNCFYIAEKLLKDGKAGMSC